MKAKTHAKAIYVFLQFESMNGKKKFEDAVNISLFKRFWYNFCCLCYKKKL